MSEKTREAIRAVWRKIDPAGWDVPGDWWFDELDAAIRADERAKVLAEYPDNVRLGQGESSRENVPYRPYQKQRRRVMSNHNTTGDYNYHICQCQKCRWWYEKVPRHKDIDMEYKITREDAYVSVDTGWKDLIDQAYDELEKYPEISIVTVKEKFGGLRIYIDFHNEEFQEFLLDIERRSFNICEICGKDGTTRKLRGWIKARCPEHIEL